MALSEADRTLMANLAQTGDLLALGNLLRDLASSATTLADFGVTASAVEINNAADVSARAEVLTATAAVPAGVMSVELNHISTVIAATIADLSDHQGLLVVKNTSASGTAAHTVTAAAGTWDGTNDVITLDAPNDCIGVWIDSNGNGTVAFNVGSVGLS